MNPYTASTDPARARIAAELARYYGLQAPDPEPAFSLSRLLRQLVSQHGLQTGREQEVCQAQSMAVGENWHQFAARLPWSALATTRALLGTPGANNSGFLTAGTSHGNVLATTLRPFSVVTQAGATMLDVPQATGDFAIPTVSTAPTGAWLIEGAAATPASVVTGSVSLTPRSAAVVVEVSRQLLKQAPAMTDALFEAELLTTAGKLLDVAAIGGAGGVEPLGLLSCTGIAATAGAALAWSAVVGMRADVLAGGAQESRLMWLADPATQEILAGRERFAGAGEIWRDGAIAGIKAVASSSVPAGTLILGDWASLAVAVWGGVVLERNPYASFASGGESVRVMVAADVAVLRPAAFAIATSVT